MRLRVVCVRAAVVALVVFWVDQLTKSAVNNTILPGERRPFMPGLQLVNVHNHGYLIGVGFIGSELRLILAAIGFALTAIVFTGVLYNYRRRGALPGWVGKWSISRFVWLPIGLMLGGSIGNMGEVFSKGSATDFLHIAGSRYAFNLADLAGLLGGLMMMVLIQPIRVKANVGPAGGQLPPAQGPA
jgi:signal peptidase II